MRAIWIEPATHEVSVLEIEASPRNLRELLGARIWKPGSVDSVGGGL
jgi:hypothetical protein